MSEGFSINVHKLQTYTVQLQLCTLYTKTLAVPLRARVFTF